MMLWQVVDVKPVAPLVLEVTFADGTNGKVQFNVAHLTGVYAPLKDPQFFARVFVDGGAVAWPGNVEMAPDAMYDALKTNGEWVLN